MTDLSFADLDRYLLEKKGRIMHQIWFGTIPNKEKAKKTYQDLKMYRDSWKTKNPGWCIFEWSKKNCTQLVTQKYPEYLNLFKGYAYDIQRCDAVRYLILHRYGGWYIDMDYYCSKSFDTIPNLDSEVYLVESADPAFGRDTNVSNALMYSSSPNHPFWKQLMLELQKNRETPGYYPRHLVIMQTTGPGILSTVYEKYKHVYRVKSLPYKQFHPYGMKDVKLSLLGRDVYAVHLGKGTWESLDSFLAVLITRDWPLFAFIIGVYFLMFIAILS